MIKYFDILKQYVNTGKPIPEYQLEKIINRGKGLVNSYFRARVNMIRQRNSADIYFKDYEVKYFENFSREMQVDLLKKLHRFDFLLKHSKNPDKLAMMIIETEGYALNTNSIFDILEFSNNPENFVKIIVKNKGNKLEPSNIRPLFLNYGKKEELGRMIIDVKGDALKSNRVFIGFLLLYTPNRNEIKDLLLKNGVDKNDINKAISAFAIETDPIP